MKFNTFVSYSTDDFDLVKPIVQLMRVNGALIFFDKDTLQPGKKWEEQLYESINQARLIVVFWCEHSSKSHWVEKEYTLALQSGKDILPLLLDNTPLIDVLKPYQGIDFRKTVGNTHKSSEQQRQQQAEAQRQRLEDQERQELEERWRQWHLTKEGPPPPQLQERQQQQSLQIELASLLEAEILRRVWV